MSTEAPENSFVIEETEPGELADPIRPDVSRVDPSISSDNSETDSPAEPRRVSGIQSARERIARARSGATTNRNGSRDSRAERPARPVPPKPREGSLVRPLTDIYTSIGLMLAPIDSVCSAAILTNAEACAKSVEKLARENESVRRIVTRLLETSAWGGVVIAHLPILVMVLVHHGPKDMQDRLAVVALALNPAAMENFAASQAAQKQGDAGPE